MGKSSSQVVGYRYYAKFAAFIGNRIEKLIGINFDNRKWVIHDPLKHPPNLLPVLEGNLFGENEGGVSGNVDIHFGYPNQEPNTEYQKYFPLVSGYPYQSYLVFRSLTGGAPSLGEGLSPAGFYLGNSGYMKEMLLWVKRTRVRNDGREQWYDSKAEVPEGGGTITLPGDPTTDDPLDIPMDLYVSRQLNADDRLIISEPELVDVRDKTGFWWGGGWSTSLSDDLKPASFVSKMKGPYSRWVGGMRVKTSPQGSVHITGGTFIGIDDDGWDNYSIDFVGEALDIVIQTNNTKWISWSNLYLQRFGVPVPEVPSGDINPVHKIREILTDDTAMGKPEPDINDSNFRKAADRIWTEGLGISWAIDEKSCIEAIEELCYHIEAGVRVNRQTGLYETILFRDDWFAEDEIHDIPESKIKDLSLEIMNSDDIVNQLNVTYYDRQRIKNSTFSVYENGSILTMGHANAESVDFPYFMHMRNAEIVANWKLKQFSTPAWSGSFTTGWKEARKWNRYDLIRLPWSSKWNGTILARIMKINLGNGTNNTVTIDFEEVIPYSGEMNTSIVVDTPIDAGPQPPQPSMNAIFEAPYYLTVLRAGQTNADLELSNNPDIGYVVAIAAKPQNNSLSALLYTDGGIGEFEQVSRLDYCDILQLDQPIIETTSSFTVTGSLTQAANSNNVILLNDEFMGFVSFDDATKVLTVKRGVLDTVPRKHGSGSLFVFDLPDVAFDSTQYAQSEIVEAQVLTTTPSGIEDLAVTGIPIEIQARAIRPYPPANVKINGEYWPDEVNGDLVITWADRNRLQQTGGKPIGWYESGVIVENGVTYTIKVIGLDSNTIVHDGTISGNNHTIPQDLLESLNRIELHSIRGTHESLEKYVHIFETSNVIPDVSNKLVGSVFLSNTGTGSGTLSPHASTQAGDTLILVIMHRGNAATATPVEPGWVKIAEQLMSSTNTADDNSAKVSIWQKAATDTSAQSFSYTGDYRSAAIYTFRGAAISVVKNSTSSEMTIAKNQDASLLVLVCANAYANIGSSPQITNQSNYLGRSLVLFDPSVFYAQQAHYLTQALKTTSVGVNLIEHTGKSATYSRSTIALEIL